MKTVTVILEVEYTCGKPDALELARQIESKFTTPNDGLGEARRAIVRVISENR